MREARGANDRRFLAVAFQAGILARNAQAGASETKLARAAFIETIFFRQSRGIDGRVDRANITNEIPDINNAVARFARDCRHVVLPVVTGKDHWPANGKLFRFHGHEQHPQHGASSHRPREFCV